MAGWYEPPVVWAMLVRVVGSSAVSIWYPSTSTVVPAAVPTPTVSMCTPAFSAAVAAAMVASPLPESPPSENSTIVAEPQ